jgi:hypothetical protein
MINNDDYNLNVNRFIILLENLIEPVLFRLI